MLHSVPPNRVENRGGTCHNFRQMATSKSRILLPCILLSAFASHADAETKFNRQTAEAVISIAKAFRPLLLNTFLSQDGEGASRWGFVHPITKPFPKNRLVVILHGLHSSPETTSARYLVSVAKKQGVKAELFAYPNDQSIFESSRLLAKALRKLESDFPETKITLVGKSMGGLVARVAVEADDPPENVDKLLQIATPNYGSHLAAFAFALELWEHLVESRRPVWKRFYDAYEDGLGEAGDELIPGSPFLTKINTRPRNPNVSYSILLGSRGYLSETDVALIHLAVAMLPDQLRKEIPDNFEELLGDMDEVVSGKGDGAVSIARGKLPGVTDVVVLPFDHLGGSEMSKPLKEAVEKRLFPPIASAKPGSAPTKHQTEKRAE